MLHATAGYILDVQQGAEPTAPTDRDRTRLETWARIAREEIERS